MNLTIKDLKAVYKKLQDNFNKPVRYYQVHSIPAWKFAREHTHFCFTKWTDEELENHDSKGFIGEKCGVECYVDLPIKIPSKQNKNNLH